MTCNCVAGGEVAGRRRLFWRTAAMIVRASLLAVRSAASVLHVANSVQKAGVHSSSVKSLQYGWLAYILGERTTPRLKRFSKIFSVDGNLASGKGTVAQKLSDKMGMLYMPEADSCYLDTMTKEKEPLPVDFNGMCSLEKFYADPNAADGNSYRLQLWMYSMRLLQYANAVEHLLTTGQGVILERSPFSDYVFLDAMLKQGYIRKECVAHYNEIKGISICEFLPPHLVIYVDQPAEDVHKTLKESGKPFLQNDALQYLKNIEDSYKKSFLPQISETSEVLTYGASQAQDVERVAEDIEYLKFDKGPWLDQDDVTYHHMRMLVQDKHSVACLTCIPKFLPEITVGAHEFDEKYFSYKSLPGKKYAEGYNADIGDKNIWLK
ncbi:NADH dehydrogenase [ubiquinone] 1 alpha subcomplex subunit 10, mitochondrial [Thalassophryne amazonica]|uniref:NADH dehydrogenase [ubiquinone] 1 alpha subcomplex subunit 10, mitochondrial n=1 Tax=Thalassophryne amazonica TaxID=390379 RepID=UPI0014712C06|nr:NADH dehydrogenase [ubiquinone] 1 alpha subcomplex subunit 10, mitochondrial [Thalassophryne amazonica]